MVGYNWFDRNPSPWGVHITGYQQIVLHFVSSFASSLLLFELGTNVALTTLLLGFFLLLTDQRIGPLNAPVLDKSKEASPDRRKVTKIALGLGLFACSLKFSESMTV